MKKRRLIVLTESEARLIYSVLDEALGAGGLSGYQKRARGVLAKLTSSRRYWTSVEDINQLDIAAGNLLDNGEWQDFNRGRKKSGSPYRAREALRVATRTK